MTRSLSPPRELGDVVRDGIVEVDLALVVQDHERRRRADDFGQRREIVDGAVGGRPAALLLVPAQASEALLPDGGAPAADDDRGAGIAAGLDAALDDVVDLGEALARHADGRRRLHGKAAADVRQRMSGDQQRQH